MGKVNTKPLATSVGDGDTLAGVQGGVVKQFLAAMFAPRAAAVAYASAIAGVTLDADPDLNTATDNTAALNGFLAGGGKELVIDGPCGLAGTLRPESTTTIRFTPNGFLFKIGGAAANGLPLIWNKNPVVSGTPIDHDITVADAWRVDGNRRNYGSGNTQTGDDALTRAIANNSHYCVPAIAFTGVQYLVVDGVRVYDSAMGGLLLANCWDVTARNYSKWSRPGDFVTSNDILDILGGCRRVKVFGLGGTAADDAIAVAPTSVQESVAPPQTFDPAMAQRGPVDDVLIAGVSVTCANLMRIMSGRKDCPAKNVTVENAQVSLTGLSTGQGYSTVIMDDFATGDGSHGLIDWVKLRNVTADGQYLAPSYPILIDRANVKHLEVDRFVNRGYTVPGNATLMLVTGNATFGQIDLRGGRDEATDPVNPSVVLQAGAVGDELVIDGHRYDLADPALLTPLPVYYNGPVVQTAATLKRLALSNVKGAGVAHLVKVVGVAPADLSVTGCSLIGSKGGAAVKSDVALPRFAWAGIDADLVLDAPAGTLSLPAGPAGWYATLKLRDLFAGNANANLSGHTADSGATYAYNGALATSIFLTGDGYLYAGGNDSVAFVSAGGQPASGNFTVEFDARRLTAIDGTNWMELALFSNPADYAGGWYGLQFNGNGFAVVYQYNTTVFQSTASLPALPVVGPPAVQAAVWRVRLTVTSAGNNRTVKSQYSADGGRTWAQLMADAAFTTALTPWVSVFAHTQGLGGAVPWTAATGHQIGGLVVMQ